jgi:hypothetical protein
VRLRSQVGSEQVVLAFYLMAGDLPPGGLTHGWSR